MQIGAWLRAFIGKHVKRGDRGKLIYEIRDGKIRPSKNLSECKRRHRVRATYREIGRNCRMAAGPTTKTSHLTRAEGGEKASDLTIYTHG